MLDHWEFNGPPVYVSVAGYLGLIKERPKAGKGKAPKAGDLNELAKMFSSTGGMIQ